MEKAYQQKLRPVGQSTKMTTTVEGNVAATAPRPTVNQNTECHRALIPPPGLSTGEKDKEIFNSPDQLVRESEDDTGRSSDLRYNDSHRLNREVLHFKKILDVMWLQNIGQNSFIYTKTSVKK